MDLPIHLLPIIQHWDCHASGGCCRRHTVILDAEDLARIRAQQWEARPAFRGSAVTHAIGWRPRQVALAQRADGSCIFLLPDGKCQIHLEFGESAKPWPCRIFPFELIPLDDHVRVSLRFNCPSVAGDRGGPVRAHLPLLHSLADKALSFGTSGLKSTPPPAVIAGGRADWKLARGVLDKLEQVTLDPNAPIVRRLVTGLRLCGLLADLPAARRGDHKLLESLPILRRHAEQATGTFFMERTPPAKTSALLFRQSAADYARFHSNLGDRPGLAARWRGLRAAWQMARGQGQLPRLHPDLPVAAFSDLEAPLGALSSEVMQPITRFFEANVAGVRYCGVGRAGWSIVDGYRALGLAFSVGLWLLRWLSHGRAPTPEDAILVVGILDRSHDYPLLGGWKHRRRLTVLAASSALENLAAWYAR